MDGLRYRPTSSNKIGKGGYSLSQALSLSSALAFPFSFYSSVLEYIISSKLSWQFHHTSSAGLKSAIRPIFEKCEAVIDQASLFKLGCNVMLGAIMISLLQR